MTGRWHRELRCYLVGKSIATDAPINPHAIVEAHGDAAEAHADHTLMYVSAGLAIFGIAAAYWLFVKRRDLAEKIRDGSPALFDTLHNKYYIDELNDTAIVGPLRKSGTFLYGVDRFVVDGLVFAVTAVPRGIGFVLRALQNGGMQNYGVSMTAGMIIVVLMTWWISGY